MIRVISLVVAGFLFLSTLEGWAGFWLAGRWFISSRYASLTLGVVKGWLDRGIINSATQTAKIFIQRNGKWILLTLGLSQVISEVQQKLQSSASCYLPVNYTFWLFQGSSSVSCNCGGSYTSKYFSATSNCSYGATVYVYQGLRVYEYQSGRWVEAALIPMWGEYFVRDSRGNVVCTFRVEQKVFNVCSDLNNPPSTSTDWQGEKRQVPVPRIIPKVDDFVRPDVIASDPALSYLRDEYQRIANDTSIPTIPQDSLSGVELPEISWSIPPEEATDTSAESGSTSQSSDQTTDIPTNVPGLDTSLPSLEKRPFPIELINSLVQNHPLLRILSNINFDAGSGGSCQIGSGVFTIDFCNHAWVLNLMGAIIVPIAFLVGLFGWRND
jgi:hypothetical protein